MLTMAAARCLFFMIFPALLLPLSISYGSDLNSELTSLKKYITANAENQGLDHFSSINSTIEETEEIKHVSSTYPPVTYWRLFVGKTANALVAYLKSSVSFPASFLAYLSLFNIGPPR